MQYGKIHPDFREQFFALAEGAEKIVITSHYSPDEDSVSSVLSVYSLLFERFPEKSIRMVYTGETATRFKVFENYEKVEFVPELADAIGGADLLIMLDGSQYSRFSNDPAKLRSCAKKTACIDHHSSPVEHFDLSVVDPAYPSNAEVIYRLFFHDREDISKDLAETLLLGILGDTGNFSYLKPHQTDTLLIGKRLLDVAKIEIQEFQSRYRTLSMRAFALIREFIRNTEYHDAPGWPRFQTSFLDRAFKDKGGYTDNEVSEAKTIYMAHYVRVVENHPWGFVVIPKSNGDCTVSLRSLPRSVNTRMLVESMGIGGGHDRASGGLFKADPGHKLDARACRDEMLEWISRNKPSIT